MRKAFGILIIICLMLPIVSCFDGPWTDILNDVPFFPQEQDNYCAVACVKMWAHYDGNTNVTQNEIANYIGVTAFGSFPENIVEGVDHFTDSYGFLVEKYKTNIGQDICIAGCIASIKDFTPAIMPFLGGIHGVLAIGYQWHYENDIRIADKMWYHDPGSYNGDYKVVAANYLKMYYFLPVGNFYYVILGKRRHYTDGLNGYNIFIDEGGTFYGGPANYDPLSFDPFEN